MYLRGIGLCKIVVDVQTWKHLISECIVLHRMWESLSLVHMVVNNSRAGLVKPYHLGNQVVVESPVVGMAGKTVYNTKTLSECL